jgi:hypothetical protein
MAWAVVPFNRVNHEKADTLCHMCGLGIVCAITDTVPTPDLHAMIGTSGLTFIAMQGNGSFTVLGTPEVITLLAALAAVIPNP